MMKSLLIGLVILLPVFYNTLMAYFPPQLTSTTLVPALIYSPDQIERLDIQSGDVIPSFFAQTDQGRIFIPPDHLFGEHDWREVNTDIKLVKNLKDTEVRYGQGNWKYKNIWLEGVKYIYVRSYSVAPAGNDLIVHIYRVSGKDIHTKLAISTTDKNDLGIDAVLEQGSKIYIYGINNGLLNGTGRIIVIDGKIRGPSVWEAATVPWKCDIRVKFLYSMNLLLYLFISTVFVVRNRRRKKIVCKSGDD
jgi:hypothetical protein